MGKVIYWELEYVLNCILWGAALMIAYDILRIQRAVWKEGDFRIAVEDILYWCIAALGTFLLLFRQDNGVIRWFTIAGLFLAMLIWNYAVSRWSVALLTRLIEFPLHLIGKIWNTIAGFFTRRIKNVWRRLKLSRKKVKIKESEAQNNTK